MISYKNTAQALLRLTRWWSMNDVWDCGMAYTIGPTFEEAYEIRAAIISDRVLHIGQVKQVVHSFCDRALSTQGVAEDNMYYMGYASNRDANGVPSCSCVADACSSAAAILDTVKAYPDSPRRSCYIASVERFADYVLDKYADDNGVMGVGILGHNINPWKQYWCACSLLVQVLIDLYELTDELKYLDAVIPQLEYLSNYDYKNTPCNSWGLAATEVVMYAGEGIVTGLNSESVCNILASLPALSIGTAVNDKTNMEVTAATNRVKADEVGDTLGGENVTALDALKLRWVEFSDWLYRNQELGGIWQDAKDYRCYQLGLSWLLAESCKSTGATYEIEVMIDRQMACMVGVEGITYHGLFCRPFATALAHFSAARIAELCVNEDEIGFRSALTDARDRLSSVNW